MESRVEINPNIMAGKPVIKGTRIPVYLILDLLAAGKGPDEIIKEYPTLKDKDIIAAIQYASNILKREEVIEIEA
jgi:uncharacterized protein (DUF433 family)